MKKISKKIQTTIDSIEAYSCHCTCTTQCTVHCSCSCSDVAESSSSSAPILADSQRYTAYAVYYDQGGTSSSQFPYSR